MSRLRVESPNDSSNPNSRRSLYQWHVDRWKDCRACELHEKRHHVVFARGNIPCEVLFIGEAPGASEDIMGSPFVGPAGQLLDVIIERSVANHTFALTNLISCIPLDDDGAKVGQPPYDSLDACAPRLQEFVGICKPGLVVAVGSLARDRLKQRSGYSHKSARFDCPLVDIIHPAYLLRQTSAVRNFGIRRAIVVVSNAIAEYLDPPTPVISLPSVSDASESSAPKLSTDSAPNGL